MLPLTSNSCDEMRSIGSDQTKESRILQRPWWLFASLPPARPESAPEKCSG